MTRSRFVSCFLCLFALGFTAVASPGKNKTFGPFEAIVFDEAIIQDVKVTGDDIFIKLQPDHRNAQLTMKNSMTEGGPYRKWFNGKEVWEAMENTGRAANAWSDRLQSGANYIDYYAEGKLFLRLKRQ